MHDVSDKRKRFVAAFHGAYEPPDPEDKQDETNDRGYGAKQPADAVKKVDTDRQYVQDQGLIQVLAYQSVASVAAEQRNEPSDKGYIAYYCPKL